MLASFRTLISVVSLTLVLAINNTTIYNASTWCQDIGIDKAYTPSGKKCVNSPPVRCTLPVLSFPYAIHLSMRTPCTVAS